MLERLWTYFSKFNLKTTSFIKMAECIMPKTLEKRTAAESNQDSSSQPPKKKKKGKQQIQLGQDEGCKRKIALLSAYNGAGYYGVQINPGFPTIESELFPALVKIGAITEEHATKPSKMWFQRGSRTDKGVSAVGQIFSLKALLVPDFISKLNEALPSTIRALGYVRTTQGFDSKKFCTSRTYMYMIPTFAFAPIEEFITDEYRITPDIIERVREVLKKYLGTHKFHNFTSGVKFEEACASRYIMHFECSEPYVRDGLEFVTMRVKGQSFMLHHIRKMIGLTIAIVRGYCGEPVLDKCWGPYRVDVPKAPGLGLVLEELHFDGYNKKFGKDGVHEPVEWSKYTEEVDQFKEKQIISSIVAQEKSDRVTFNWMRTLQFHNFDETRLEGPEKPWAPIAKMLREDEKAKKSLSEEESSTQKTTKSETGVENTLEQGASLQSEEIAQHALISTDDTIKQKEILSETTSTISDELETQQEKPSFKGTKEVSHSSGNSEVADGSHNLKKSQEQRDS